MGTYTDPFTPTEHLYECVDCGGRVESTDHLGSCDDCGGQLRNLSVPRD